MARRYAPVMCSIWDDPDFVALDPSAQRLYILLLSQRKLSMVGAVPYTPRNWSRGCAATTANDIETSLTELVAARFVLVDYDTDELLVRTVLKHDPPRGPKSRAAMWRALIAIDSEILRREVAIHITVDIWDDPTAKPPDELKYLRNAPSDAPADEASDGASDGARTHAHARTRASSSYPATDPPASCYRVQRSSSVLTVDGNAADDDDFARTVQLIVDAKEREHQPRNPRAWRQTVHANTIAEDGELICRMLKDGDPPDQIAALVLGHADNQRPPSTPWCAPDCRTCAGLAWVWVDDELGGLAPCPDRKVMDRMGATDPRPKEAP